MADDFRRSVEFGLRLSERIYYGKDSDMLKPPKQPLIIEDHLIPTAPMVYALIPDPSVVENPDIRSYQPYVHGKCDPPALIPLHMHGIQMEVNCYLDTAFITLTATWRVHCVSSGKKCHCVVAIPMGEQGSVLGVELEAICGSHETQLIKLEDAADLDGLVKTEYRGFIKPNIFTLKTPKVDGGSKLLVKAKWSQRLVYRDHQFRLSLPFNFPVYVIPAGEVSKREKIQLNVSCGTSKEVLCTTATHPLKELKRKVDGIDFLYEAEVKTWSNSDFEFSYTVSSNDIHGEVLLWSPPLNDVDQRNMFGFYLFPGDSQNRKVFRKRVLFLVDISASMIGAPIVNVMKAILASLSELNHDDFFNIIAFNGEMCLFSSSMELATPEGLRQASKWMNLKLIPEGDTNILLPLNQALEMVARESNLMTFIFLVTDGAVENERDICNVVKDCMNGAKQHAPRLSTLGIGSYCNHYFLQMLAQIGRGHYDAAYDADSVAPRLHRLFTLSSSVILSDIEVDWFNSGESLELYPSASQHLSYEYPVITSGRCKGNLPESLNVSGTLADMSKFTTKLQIQKAKDIPLDKVFAQRQIDILTAKAWFTQSKEIEDQVAEISMKTGLPSEYTRMILVQTDCGDEGLHSVVKQGNDEYKKMSLKKMVHCKKMIPLPNLGIGFGDLKNTIENLAPGVTVKETDTTDMIIKTATGCCSQVVDRVCCLCFIKAFSTMSNQCVITLSQICAALACCECVECCYDLCG